VLTVQQTIEQIKKGEMAPIYVLLGTENFFIEQLKRSIFQSIEKKQSIDVMNYDLQEVAIQDVVVDAETLPFFTDHKIIVATNPLFLTNQRTPLDVTHETEQLERYVQHPVGYSTLIIVAPYEKIDGRKGIVKHLHKHTTVVNCEPIRDYDLRKWITYLAKGLQISITDDALYVMEAEYGNNLYLLQQELEKMKMYVGAEKVITKETVENLMAVSASKSALDLVDVVLRRNLYEAIKIYKSLEKNNEDPIGLLALLASQFRLIFQVKLLQENGFTSQSMRGKIQAHPYAIRLAVERSKKFSTEQLAKVLDQLTETDAAIKRGLIDKSRAFELLLYELVAQK